MTNEVSYHYARETNYGLVYLTYDPDTLEYYWGVKLGNAAYLDKKKQPLWYSFFERSTPLKKFLKDAFLIKRTIIMERVVNES
jgi:hypothetical protein